VTASRAVQGHLTPGQRRPRYGQPFWPVTIFGSAMYITATAIALIVLSLIHPADSFYSAPDNGAVIPADPINHTAYNPRPEWYFLFLFQILKYFQVPGRSWVQRLSGHPERAAARPALL
jgi:ubiquinol-cytochrome c reductase cytochrome b subunit